MKLRKHLIRIAIKKWLLAVLGYVSRRHPLFLPHEAGDEDSILAVRAAYRVTDSLLRIILSEPGVGRLDVAVMGYVGHFPTQLIHQVEEVPYSGPCELSLNVSTGRLTLGEAEIGGVPLPLPGRRFCLRFVWHGNDGKTKNRLTGHYLPVDSPIIGKDYYAGSNYVDHEAQSEGDHAEVIHLLRQYRVRGPVLEIGCATGGLLLKLDAEGFAPVGLDISEWAVERANERLSKKSAWVCDVERQPIPEEVVRRGPYRAVALWSVFEHFHDPFLVLRKLEAVIAPETVLLISTTNADSLCHFLFGEQWEGHFDWSHYGVEKVSVRSLRAELPMAGWQIVHLDTKIVWDVDADPTHATLRDWWAGDARFRCLLRDHELGDLITCVAVRK